MLRPCTRPVLRPRDTVQARRSASRGLSGDLGRTASGGGAVTSRRRLKGPPVEGSDPSAGTPLPRENDTAEVREGGAAYPDGSGSGSGSGAGRADGAKY